MWSNCMTRDQVEHDTLQNLNFKSKTKYVLGKTIRTSALVKGMKLMAYYNDCNQGADVVEFLGFCDDDSETIKYSSMPEMRKATGCKTMEALELYETQNNLNICMVLRDLTDNTTGPWYYLSGEGRFCRGSGAEALSFTELKSDSEVAAAEAAALAIKISEQKAKEAAAERAAKQAEYQLYLTLKAKYESA